VQPVHAVSRVLFARRLLWHAPAHTRATDLVAECAVATVLDLQGALRGTALLSELCSHLVCVVVDVVCRTISAVAGSYLFSLSLHNRDDKKFDMVRRQIEYGGGGTKGRKRSKGSGVCDLFEDSSSQLVFGSFEGDEELPVDVPVDPCLFYPETSEWGYTEDEMLVCDNCDVWVHAGCSRMTEDEYEVTSNGDHPIYSKEYLCRVCCRERCKGIIAELQKEDRTMLFAQPVSEKIVPNYRDIIKEPMDLQTMLEKAESEEYLNYAWVREMFELMVLNALTFNRYVSH